MWYFKLCNNFRQINFIRYVHKTKLQKMDCAYFRHLDGTEHFDMVLEFNNSTLGINRQFNFKRQLSEPIETFLGRVATNIDKVVSKKLKRKKNEKTDSVNLEVNLLNEHNEIIDKTLTCKEVFNSFKDLRIRIQDTILNIKINSPWIEKITLPNSILCGFPVYPSKFETLFTDKDKSIFIWQKSLPNENNWQEVGNNFFYIPCVDDIGYKLKLICEPRNDIASGPKIEVETTVVVEAGPGFCPFETRHAFTNEKLSGKNFRVVSYNILADLYCDSDYSRETLYPYCPSYALAIDYRKQLILKELIGYKSDIICLQEVDEKMFSFDLLPVLSRVEYDGVFSKKGGTVTEGLCCLFDKNRFKLLSSDIIILGQELNTNSIFSDLWQKIETNQPLCDRLLPRTTAFQYTILQSIDNNNEILIVGNTHLYFHPNADHIRLFQAGLIMKYVEHLVETVKAENSNKRISLVICGDFNSVPECGTFRLLTTGSVPETCIDWSSNENEAIKNVSLSQPFQMGSACGTPKYTTYTVGFADCLDYIFYQMDHLCVTQVIPFPTENELTAHTALPSIVFPSDHIALISDLKWI